MKNTFIILSLLLTAALYAQVGVGSTTPRGALDINNPTINTMGLVLPTNANVNNMVNLQGGAIAQGTLMYDSTLDCIRYYRASSGWSGCIAETTVPAAITNLQCASTTGWSTMTTHVPYNFNISIPYQGGNGGTYSSYSVNSTGVTGLTATLNAGTINTGSGSLVFNITGTAFTTGTATFNFSFGGRSCTINRSVSQGDAIRYSLVQGGGASIPAYDAATPNNWIQITKSEYDALSGPAYISTTKGMASDADMNGTPNGGNTAGNSHVVYNAPIVPIPAGSYIIAFRAKSGSTGTAAAGTQLAFHLGNNNPAGPYSILGGSFQSYTLTAGQENYFVIKRPTIFRSFNGGPGYVSVYTPTASQIGTGSPATSAYNFGNGNVSNLNTNGGNLFMYYQVKSTTVQQW